MACSFFGMYTRRAGSGLYAPILQASYQRFEVRIQVLSVFLPCYVVHATGSVSAKPHVACLEVPFVQ